MVIGVIGGGASGMMAALAAAQKEENRVLLFERQGRVGKKLLATGNGRCNLSNRNMGQTHYHGDAADFSQPALTAFSVEQTLSFLEGLGLYTVTEPSGRVYPYSDQANSVVDVLRFALEKTNITVKTGCEISRIRRQGDGFSLSAGEEAYCCDKVIVACGGLAGGKLGGSMAGYKLLRGLGHRCTALRPALVQLKSSARCCPSLKGIRAHCHAEIFRDGVLFAQSTGEVQFTETGISGPAIFEISRDVCREKGTWQCVLDLLPELDREAAASLLERKKASGMRAEELFTGVLHNRLGRIITASAGISLQGSIALLSRQELLAAASCAKAFSLDLTEPLGMDSAQVTAGGIITGEFDPETLESNLVPGLYACGEVLDVDGDCGGYNLQWAWSSGYVAGTAAGGGALD